MRLKNLNSSSLFSDFSSIMTSVKIGLFTLLTLSLVPIIIILSIPFLIYRRINQFLVRKMYPHSVKMVHPMGQMFAPDFFKSSPRYNIIFCGIFDGHVPYDDFVELFKTTVLYKKDVQSGNFKYEELHYNCVKHGGFFYWKKKKEEALATDYVHLYKLPQKPCRDEDLKKIVAQLIAQGWNWKEGQSPFEIYLIHNYVGEPLGGKLKTVMVIKTHHFIVDGCSLFDIILSLLKGNLEPHVQVRKESVFSDNFIENSAALLADNFNHWFPLLLKLPRDFYQAFINPSADSNVWRLGEYDEEGDCAHSLKRKFHVTWSRGIDIQHLKTIKNRFNVSFQSVAAAVVAKAAQNLMVSAGQEVPKEVKTVIPIPLPGHPDRLENYFGFVTAQLPIGECDPMKRLQMAHEQLKNASYSLNPWMTYQTFIIGGHFPSFISKHIMNSDMGNTVDFSTFPGIKGPSYICGFRVLEAFNLVGTGPKYIGATLTALTCFGKIKFAINIDFSIFPDKGALEKFDDFIQQEIDALLQKSALQIKANFSAVDSKDIIIARKKLNSYKA